MKGVVATTRSFHLGATRTSKSLPPIRLNRGRSDRGRSASIRSPSRVWSRSPCMPIAPAGQSRRRRRFGWNAGVRTPRRKATTRARWHRKPPPGRRLAAALAPVPETGTAVRRRGAIPDRLGRRGLARGICPGGLPVAEPRGAVSRTGSRRSGAARPRRTRDGAGCGSARAERHRGHTARHGPVDLIPRYSAHVESKVANPSSVRYNTSVSSHDWPPTDTLKSNTASRFRPCESG